MPEQPHFFSDAAGEPERRAYDDDEHEAACANMRAALRSEEGLDSEPWQRMLRGASKAGWPQNGLEVAEEAAISTRGKIYDLADGRGGGGPFFRARIPGALRHHIELSFDLMFMGGVREPSMMIRLLAHMARDAARVHGDTPSGRELLTLADLFEEYPAQAVDYAAEWVAHVDKRMGGER